MVIRSVGRVTACCVVAFCWVSASAMGGGDCPIDLGLIGQWNEGSSAYSDVWGDGDVAYVGQFGPVTAGVHFIDVSEPTNPVEILEWQVPSPNQSASPQDVKVANGLLFIALESNPNDGVEIVDVRDPFNPQHLSWIRTPQFSTVHSMFYDSGYLYLANSFTRDVGVVDLSNFDPDNPPVRIENSLWSFQVGNSFVHDITAENGRLYVAAWNSGLHVFDTSNVANEAPVFLGSSAPADNDSTHAVWPTPDGRWAVVTEERPGGPMKLFEINPTEQGAAIVLRDTITQPIEEAFSAHNPVVVGTRVYVSWYQAGMFIYDIDEVTGTLVELAQFDTFDGAPFGFNGAWGVYPFLGEDRILVSDIVSGLFVLGEQSLISVSFPDGLLESVHPIDGATLTVELASLCANPDPATAKVIVQIDSLEGGVIEVPLVSIGGDLYEADMPGAPCGSLYSYYVTVDTLAGETVVDPAGAPAITHEANVLSSVAVVFADNFEQDQGWSVSEEDCPSVGIETGAWERVDPNGVFLFPPGIDVVPEDDYPGGEGTMCYVTGQGTPGGNFDAADVDGGPVRLISPVIETTGQDAVIRFVRWFISANLQGFPGDPLLVEISTDGGGSWVLAEQIDFDFTLDWVQHEIRVSDVMPLGDTLRVRFSAQDCPDSSITEALIDEFSVTVISCEDVDTTPPAIVHDDGKSTHPFSGYIDPRRESSNGNTPDQGVETVALAFTEFVHNVGGGDLDATAFSMTSTGGAAADVVSIDASGNPQVVLTLSDPLRPGSWHTVIARVEDGAGNVILDGGNQGPGVEETDRVDIGFLPADVDQSGSVTPFDLLAFRQLVNGVITPAAGVIEDFADIDRDGSVMPFDLLAFRQLINGVPPATQSWSGEELDAPQP